MSRPRTRLIALPSALVVVIAAALLAVVLLPRSDDSDWTSAHPAPHVEGTLDAGFHAPAVDRFYSGQVVEPDPETWGGVRPSSAYRVLVLAAGRDGGPADAQVAILVAAAQRWADEEDRVSLKIRYLDDPATYIQGIDDASTQDHADLIVIAGNDLVEPVAVVSANYAGYDPQQYLVLGAEVAEPTTNIAASDWTGSAYLGEGLDEARFYRPSAVTPSRAYAALRAGVAAVLSGLTSVIVRIPVARY